MKLVIYETTHHETLPAMLDLATQYFEQIVVFLKKSSYENLCATEIPEKKWQRAIFILQHDHTPNRRFIGSAFEYLHKNDCTHLHVSTLDNNLLYFAWNIFLARKKISLSVQAVNEYCVYKFKNIRDLSESIAKKYLHRRIRQYRIFFPAMAEPLTRSLPASQPHFIPSRFYEGNITNRKEDGVFRITIPGALDLKRRDYLFVSNAMKTVLSDPRLNKKIELVLLGNSNTEYGKAVLTLLSPLVRENFSLKSFEHYVNQKDYENELSHTDILWSPLTVETFGIRNTPETYGHSTATGLTADLLLNAKPALIPKGFDIPEHYEHALIPYASASEFNQLFFQFLEGGDENISEKIDRQFSFFRREYFVKAFCALMEIDKPD